ncbi:MAG: hypothetical protein NC111_03680 [Bacteroides sp.]|nr:hypothetical protein [Bacteroides sp.]MCM1412944.1 hypothetical protein [Bacteroides sp.]MCM1471613.1 hypothetical protein [Bacteroides sp.]
MAQAVIFPQIDQPGNARLVTGDDEIVLENDLLSASFKLTDGNLMFNGCDAMGLLPGTELFKITLGNGQEVKASEMTLVNYSAETLAGDPTATVASEKLAGCVLEAQYQYGDLSITWKAILRDGSHYLRNELTLNASQDVAMKQVVPMLYQVSAANAPHVVGNTRGAVLASETIFAGLETPTGINSIVDAASAAKASFVADNGFSLTRWSRDTSSDDVQPTNPSYWTWTPDKELPTGVSSLGFGSSDVRGKRGFAAFSSAGNHTVTFRYSSGTHGLNILGVDVVNADGDVIASDYHVGFTGGASNNNVYTLNIPEAGTYLVRIFIDVRTETSTSYGNITWSPSVSAASAPTTITGGDYPADSGFSFNSWSRDTSNDYAAAPISNPSYWTWVPGSATPAAITQLSGVTQSYVRGKRGFIHAASAGNHTVTFKYTTGTHRLNMLGVDLINSDGEVVASDYHYGYTGGASNNNTYTLNVPAAGVYYVRYFIDGSETVTSSGTITWSPAVTAASQFEVTTPGGDDSDDVKVIQGLWSRNTTLQAGKTWKVGTVVGMIAPDQARRSFLAYSERERAVPWRAFPLYNSWYELNIDRNNSATYDGHMTASDCVGVVEQWKSNLFDKYGVGIKAFVWDDGWDEYGTWTFNKGFPNGFKEPYEVASQIGAGTGAWLGPVGGYGTSGSLRRQYWENKGGMQLSNPAYYKVFLDACSDMVEKYDFCFFKLDGISAQFSSVGPDTGTTGEENAEGIIDVLSAVREIRPDMFFNTTVGTWASPFWFHYTDAVWRQEGDWGTIGNQGDDREKWITYRDRLVYQNFVQNSPLCPINTLMTHGMILTSYGDVSKSMDYAGIVREMRCAFACGSGMVELYCDAALLNSINSGALWGDLAECIIWQQQNADVLPDIHWVGGSPWDGSKCNVYGWASWNGEKATLALRNPSASAKSYTFTLREALEIPAYDDRSIYLSKAFESQAALAGLDNSNNALNIDQNITITLPASSVYVFNGNYNNEVQGIEEIEINDNDLEDNDETVYYNLQGIRMSPSEMSTGIYIRLQGNKASKVMIRR